MAKRAISQYSDLAGTVPAAAIPATAVTPGSYTNSNLTVGADGRLTAASSGAGGGAGADALGTYVVQAATHAPANAQVLASLATGLVKVTTSTGVLSTATGADLPGHSAALVTSGTLALARGGTNADLSATGGANQVLKQTSLGGAIAAAAITDGDLTAASHAALTNQANTYTAGKQTFVASTTGAASLNVPAGAAPTSPAEGDEWQSSAQQCRVVRAGGMTQGDVRSLFVGTAAAAVTTNGADTSAVPSGVGTMTLPASFLVPGKSLELYLQGVYSTVGSSAGTINVKVKVGSTVVATTTAVNLTVAMSNQYCEVAVKLACWTAGVSGTVSAAGVLSRYTNPSNVTTTQMANAAAVTLDTTGSALVDVTVNFSVAGNSWTTLLAVLRVVN